MKPFYITTPLYYVNDEPHIGHAYTTVIADVLARYHRLFGDETLLLTGVDEHGQKIQQAAKKAGRTPQEHCDEYAQRFEAIWAKLGIQYDIFYRTTDANHRKVVQECLQKLWDKGEIYSKEYEGWYCVDDEVYYTEKDLVDGKSPTGRPVEKIKETNYFFKMSKYQQRLIDELQARPELVQPDFRRNEVLGFLRQPLHDLSISRPKTRLNWGIEIPFDKDHVTYVWFDALLNYAVAVGLGQPERSSEFSKWWDTETGAGAFHLIGKDILMTHAVYWTTMLMAMEEPLPKTIFAHGWWMTDKNEKMSKSQGTVTRPLDLMSVIGVDPMRYFLVRDMKLGNDAQFSFELAQQRYNSELSNTLGNLLSRTTTLVQKYFDGKWPEASEVKGSETLKDQASKLALEIERRARNSQPDQAVEAVIQMLFEANRFLEEQAPWKTAKTDLNLAAGPLRVALEVLRLSALALHPIMPEKSVMILKGIGAQTELDWKRMNTWLAESQVSPIEKLEPLFPRLS